MAATTPKQTLVQSTKKIKGSSSRGGGGSEEGGSSKGGALTEDVINKSSLSYIPRQVLMNDYPHRVNEKVFDARNPKTATGGQNWSPIMDGIITGFPPSSLASQSRNADLGFAMKALDEYIDEVLYGPPKKKSLPVFENIRSG